MSRSRPVPFGTCVLALFTACNGPTSAVDASAADTTVSAPPDAPRDAATDTADATDATVTALDAVTPVDVSTRVDASPDVLAPPSDLVRTQSESQLSARRASCQFAAGAWAATTLGAELPVGRDIPINHVLVIIQENRSFDHYLGRLVAQGYYAAGDFTVGDGGAPGPGSSHADQLDGPPPGWSVPDVAGRPAVVLHPDDEYCYGVNHSWGALHEDWADGTNTGFVRNNNPDGQRAMFYEDDTVVPFYYALANEFAVGDRYFASVMTSTWPNRLFAMGATSFGIGDNSFVTSDTIAHPAPQIFTLLERGGHTWRDYTDGPHQTSFYPSFGFRPQTVANLKNIRCDLMNDLRNGTLPDVAYIMGDEVGGTSDEGPSALPGIGGRMVEGIVRALFASPSWHDTALFITYDENGGLADHVPPAAACPPDGFAPHDENGRPLAGDFAYTGFRVPFIVVSPYARHHFVSHTVYDHTSLLRFIEARFGLPALTARDANATPPMDLFDFAHPPFATAPDITAHTVVPPDVLARCGQSYAPLTCAGAE